MIRREFILIFVGFLIAIPVMADEFKILLKSVDEKNLTEVQKEKFDRIKKHRAAISVHLVTIDADLAAKSPLRLQLAPGKELIIKDYTWTTDADSVSVLRWKDTDKLLTLVFSDQKLGGLIYLKNEVYSVVTLEDNLHAVVLIYQKF